MQRFDLGVGPAASRVSQLPGAEVVDLSNKALARLRLRHQPSRRLVATFIT